MLLLIFPPEIQGTILNIPDDYSTIGRALVDCSEGDTLLLQPGVYSPTTNGENFPMRITSGIVIKGTNRDSCVLDAQGTGRVILCSGLKSPMTTLENLTIRGGYTEHSGAGMYIADNTTITVRRCRVFNNRALENGGGVAVLNSERVLLESCLIDSNSALLRGGGIHCDNASPVIEGSCISSNSGHNGGGLSCTTDSSPDIYNSTVELNSAGNQGGGLECYINSSPYISNCLVRYNTAVKGGGLSLQLNANATVTDTRFIENGSSTGGGAIFCSDIGEAVFKRNHIEGNSTERTGGGIYLHSHCGATIDSNTIIHNRAGTTIGSNGYGGGIVCWDGPAPVITNNTIQYNAANDEGGGIHMHLRCSGLIENNNIQFNTAGFSTRPETGWGAGVFLNQADPVVRNNVISNNTSEFLAGGIFMQNMPPWDNPDNCYPVVENNEILGNEAKYDGGAISTLICDSSYITGNIISNNVAGHGGGAIQISFNSKTYIHNNIIEGNRSEGAGGGAVFVTDRSKPIISENFIRNNSTAGGPGGAIDCLEETAPKILDNLICGNRASKGGAVHARTGATVTMKRNTCTDNRADISGGAVFAWANRAVLLIYNNTFSQNQAAGGGTIETGNNTWSLLENNIIHNNNGTKPIVINDYSRSLIRYNCLWSPEKDSLETVLDDSLHNLFEIPAFIDPENMDYRIAEGSPCIDAGNPGSPHDPDGTRADIGRFFFDQRIVSVDPSEQNIMKMPMVKLRQNNPNPFNPVTTITVDVTGERDLSVVVSIFNARGHPVKQLHSGHLGKGTHKFNWDGTDSRGCLSASGVYFCKVDAEDVDSTIKMILAK